MEAVAEESDGRTDHEDCPQREVVGRDARAPSEELANIGGDSEIVEPDLGGAEAELEVRGVGQEVGVAATDGLQPDDGN